MKRLWNMPPDRVLLLAGAIGLSFLAIWIILIILTWLVINRIGFHADIWSAFEGLSTAATLATVIGGGVVVLAQLTEAIDSREREVKTGNLEAYNTIFAEMMSDENIEARRWIYLTLPEEPEQGLAGLSDEGRRYVKLVLNSFDHLGFMIQQDWLTDDAIVQWVSPFVVKVWAKLGPYIDYEARRRNEPDYYQAARYLAERCIEWRRENVPDSKITWVERAL